MLGGLSSNPSHDLSYDLNRSGIPPYIYSTLKKKENGHMYFEEYKSIHVDGKVRIQRSKDAPQFSVLNLSKKTPGQPSFAKIGEKYPIIRSIPRRTQDGN